MEGSEATLPGYESKHGRWTCQEEERAYRSSEHSDGTTVRVGIRAC